MGVIKTIFPFAVCIAIGLIVGHLATPGAIEAHRVILEKQKKVWDHKLDSLAIVEKVSLYKDSVWTRLSRVDRASLEEERRQNELAQTQAKVWHEKYKNLQSTPATRYNEHQLDSAIDALIASRKRR